MTRRLCVQRHNRVAAIKPKGRFIMTRFPIILGAVGLLVAATTAQAASGNAGKSPGLSKPHARADHVKPTGRRSAGNHPQGLRIHCPAGYQNNDMGGCTWRGAEWADEQWFQ
jgi:hypothetical protein